MGVYYAMRYVISVMQKQKYGRIVNVASVGGIRGVLNQMPYVASKHAVSGMTKMRLLNMDGMELIRMPLLLERFLHQWLQKHLSKLIQMTLKQQKQNMLNAILLNV